MRNIILGMSALALAAVATPALADEASSDGFTISGSASVVSDYRFRGISFSSEEAAIQGSVTVSHESGLYAGFWGSSLTFGNGTEIDGIVGYSTDVGGVTLDGGVTYYMYPNGSSVATDYFEPYFSISGDVGPVSAKVGAAYVFDGQAAAGNDDNIYLYTDLSAAIPGTPVTLKGHYGYTDGSFGGAGNNYADYSIGAEASWKALTFGVSYINTSGFASKPVKELVGADSTVVFSVSASF